MSATLVSTKMKLVPLRVTLVVVVLRASTRTSQVHGTSARTVPLVSPRKERTQILSARLVVQGNTEWSLLRRRHHLEGWRTPLLHPHVRAVPLVGSIERPAGLPALPVPRITTRTWKRAFCVRSASVAPTLPVLETAIAICVLLDTTGSKQSIPSGALAVKMEQSQSMAKRTARVAKQDCTPTVVVRYQNNVCRA